jgi:hypothetical protein
VNKQDYALFRGADYYAEGGALDFSGWFDTIESAKQYAEDHRKDDKTYDYLGSWAHVAESKTMKVIASASFQEGEIEWKVE